MPDGSLFARTEHGGHRVTPLPRGFEISWPQGSLKYSSARQTIIALVNQEPVPSSRAYDPHLSFNRYFRQGRYAKVIYPQLDTLSLFQSDPPNQVTIGISTKPVESSLTVLVTPRLGIDLDNRGHEVRKLFFAGFGRMVNQNGFDPEDVLQEIYRGILVRNFGKCPFDPRKSSFGHYVHMVCNCIVSNYRRRNARINRFESFGVMGSDGEDQDVSTSDIAFSDSTQEESYLITTFSERVLQQALVFSAREGVDSSVVEKCAELMFSGMRNREIIQTLGHEQAPQAIQIVRRAGISLRGELS